VTGLVTRLSSCRHFVAGRDRPARQPSSQVGGRFLPHVLSTSAAERSQAFNVHRDIHPVQLRYRFLTCTSRSAHE